AASDSDARMGIASYSHRAPIQIPVVVYSRCRDQCRVGPYPTSLPAPEGQNRPELWIHRAVGVSETLAGASFRASQLAVPIPVSVFASFRSRLFPSSPQGRHCRVPAISTRRAEAQSD